MRLPFKLLVAPSAAREQLLAAGAFEEVTAAFAPPPPLSQPDGAAHDGANAAEAFQDRQDAMDVAGSLSWGAGPGEVPPHVDDGFEAELHQQLLGDTAAEYEAAVLEPRITLLLRSVTALWEASVQQHGRPGVPAPPFAAACNGTGVAPPATCEPLGLAAAVTLSHLRFLAASQPALCEASVVDIDASLTGTLERRGLHKLRLGPTLGHSSGHPLMTSQFVDAYVDLLWTLIAQTGRAGDGPPSSLVATASVALFNVLVAVGRVGDAALLCHQLLACSEPGSVHGHGVEQSRVKIR